MSTKSLSNLSSILTAVLLLILGALSVFVELVVLNGYGDRDGGPALIAFGICQSIGLILCVILAGWLTRVFVDKFNWNRILAVITSIIAGVIASGVFGFGSFVISVIVAETIRGS